MSRARVISGLVWAASVVAALGMFSERVGVAQDAAPAKKARPGQLPPYYGEVVDEAQRQKIYAIQAEFNPQLKALQAKLDALKKERDDKIEAVLTPEQRKQVDDLRAAAKTKRDAKKSAKVKAPPKAARAAPAKDAEAK